MSAMTNPAALSNSSTSSIRASASAAASLRKLMQDPDVPEIVRAAMAPEFAELARALAKLDNDELHLAVFGRVSVGKSALLNALLEREEFVVGVLHGTTVKAEQEPWRSSSGGGIHVIDTPGIDEMDGEARERLAFAAAAAVDLVLFVVEGDITDTELTALKSLVRPARPMLLVLNKVDRYTSEERSALLAKLIERTQGLIGADNVVAISAKPARRTVITIDALGYEHESSVAVAADVSAVKARIAALLDRDGRTISALNAGLMAAELSDQLAKRLIDVRKEVASALITTYCLTKGVAVGLNPIPVADLVAAAGLDVALVLHLSRVYGLPLTKTEAGQLIGTICAQLAVLMGAIWGVHLVASALKGLSIGLSTALTAGAQGALAYYATLLTGKAAERYLENGKSWGELGPKRVVEEILAGLDRDSVLRSAKAEIAAKLRA
jgi:GTPase